jgi:hypothetical protein
MKLKNNQSGIAHVAAILLVVVIAVVGFVGWKVWDGNKTKNGTSTSPASLENKNKEIAKPVDEYTNWKTASFELAEASFKYPSSLKLTHEVKADASANTGFETYTLTASDDTFISIVAYHFLGGFTGDEPKYLIDEVVTGTDKTNSREFSAIAYKNENGLYDTIHVMDSTQTKYKVGEEKQLFLTSFAAKPKGSNKDSSKISITFSGKKYATYKTLAELKSIGAYKDAEKFLNSLNIPAPN